jgi:hypothetical protein
VLLAAALSRSDAGKLAAGDGRCRDTGHDKGCRNYEGDDQLTHGSSLHKGCEVVLSVLPCMRGIAPRIAVDEHYLFRYRKGDANMCIGGDGSCNWASVACLRTRDARLFTHPTIWACTRIQAITREMVTGNGLLDDISTTMHNYLCIVPFWICTCRRV